MMHGNLKVAKRYIKKDSYTAHKREVKFEPIDFKFGLMSQIITVPHETFVQRKTGLPLMVQMQVDDESKELFTYESNYIIAL